MLSSLVIPVLFLIATAILFLLVVSWSAYRRSQAQFERMGNQITLLLRTGLYNTKQSNRIDATIRKTLETGLESLAFSKKANDRQRILLASLSNQTMEIANLLDANDRQEAERQSGSKKKILHRSGSDFRLTQIIGPQGRSEMSKTVPLQALLSAPANNGEADSRKPDTARIADGNVKVQPERSDEKSGTSRIMLDQLSKAGDMSDDLSDNQNLHMDLYGRSVVNG